MSSADINISFTASFSVKLDVLQTSFSCSECSPGMLEQDLMQAVCCCSAQSNTELARKRHPKEGY